MNVFLSCISSQLFSFLECITIEASADLNLYVIQERKKKKENSLKCHLFFYYLKGTISSPHVMCVFPSSTSNFPWKLTPASYTSLLPGCPCMRRERDCWEGKCDSRQTAGGSSAHMFLKLQLWADMFTFQTIHRLQWVQTGIFNYSCGLHSINKIVRRKENCFPLCLLSEFILRCCAWVEQPWGMPWLLWKWKVIGNKLNHITVLGTKRRNQMKYLLCSKGDGRPKLTCRHTSEHRRCSAVTQTHSHTCSREPASSWPLLLQQRGGNRDAEISFLNSCQHSHRPCRPKGQPFKTPSWIMS